VACETAGFFWYFNDRRGRGSGGNTLLEVDRLTHGREGSLAASVNRPHLAHDIVTSTKMEWGCSKVIVLDDPLGAISENGWKGHKVAKSVLALNVDLGDRSTRFWHSPFNKSLTARGSIKADIVLTGRFIALGRALLAAHVHREGGAGSRAALVSSD